MDTLIKDIIERRKFHEIPDWMVEELDLVGFLGLFDAMADIVETAVSTYDVEPTEFYINTELRDLMSFLDRARRLGVIAPKMLAKNRPWGFIFEHTSAAFVISNLLKTEKDWNEFLRYIDPRILFGRMCGADTHHLVINNFVYMASIANCQLGHVPNRLVDKLLSVLNMAITSPEYCKCTEIINELFVFVGTNSLNGKPTTIMEKAIRASSGTAFVDAFFDVLRERAKRYYWGDELFELTAIWDREIPYFPKKIHDAQLLVTYLWKMSRCPQYELSERVLPYLWEIVGSADTDFQNVMFKSMVGFFVEFDAQNINLNNIRFLMAFYGIALFQLEINRVLRRLLDGAKGRPKNTEVQLLRDFGCFYPKDMNNDSIQRKFLVELGGDPNTLLTKDGRDSYIRTARGIQDAILYCNPLYMDTVLSDPVVCEILVGEVIGKVPFGPVIRQMLPIVENMVRHGDPYRYRGHVLANAINKAYPMVETSNDVCGALLRISNINVIEASSIIEKYPQASLNIPVDRQSSKGLLANIHTLKSKEVFRPLYFGMYERRPGIEEIFTFKELLDLLRMDNAYFADVKSESMAQLLYTNWFMWRD